MRKSLFFVSYPRSGSNWYIEMLADSLDRTFDSVYSGLLRKSHRNMTHNEGQGFYMYRHPKDAILSHARHMYFQRTRMKIESEKVLWKLVFNVSYKEFQGLVSWWIKLMGFYMPERTKRDICYIRYEDVLKNPKKEVKKGLKALGYDVEPKVEDWLTAPTAAERLKKYTGKYKQCPFWTEKIDKMVDRLLGGVPKKYGY